MKLLIDGTETMAQPGQSLLEIVRNLGLDNNELSKRPLAAKIAGEILCCVATALGIVKEIKAEVTKQSR